MIFWKKDTNDWQCKSRRYNIIIRDTYNIIIVFLDGGDFMATVPTQVRIDENLKKQASELFSQLGMDMSSAMNIFLKQCVLRWGLPFSVELPQYKPEVLEAMEEAKRISKDPNTKRYASFSEALEDID